jgi:hypothetical protein
MSSSMSERGRQIKGRATAAFLDVTKNEIAHRWLNHRQTTREISRGLRINDREAVERAVHDVLAPRPRPFAITRRAA